MPRNSKEQVQREMEIIWKLLNQDNLKDHQIINQLQIDERTFYRYKARIRKHEMQVWAKQNRDIAEYDLGKFRQTLEDCYLINKRIAEDTSQSARDRTEATKAMVVYQAQIAKLSRDGPIKILYPSKPLPNKVEGNEKEITI